MDATPSPRFTEKACDLIRRVLEQVVAEESQLAAATRGYAWRVRRSPVQSLVRLFAEQGRQIDHWLDEVGEKSRMIGLALTAPAAVSEPLPADEVQPAGRELLRELAARHERMATSLRRAIGMVEERARDSDAANLLSGLLEFHETTVWMLRLVLNAPEARPLPAFCG